MHYILLLIVFGLICTSPALAAEPVLRPLARPDVSASPSVEAHDEQAIDQDQVQEAIRRFNQQVNERYGRIEPQAQIDSWLRQNQQRKEQLRGLGNPDEERDQLERIIRDHAR